VAVIQSYGGLILALNALTAAWVGHRRIGLYQNDWDIQSSQNISAVVPATFSGYPGLLPLLHWTAAALIGPAAATSADALMWSHSGGPVQNYVFGIYVVADDGGLDWAEAITGGPIPMYGAGGIIRYVPQYILQSKFPGL
jgi:hypothetical protein